MRKANRRRAICFLGCCAAAHADPDWRVAGPTNRAAPRIRCSAATESGICPDPKTFYLDVVERAALAGLQGEMRAPAVMAEYVRTYHQERQRLAGDAILRRATIERQIAEKEKIIRRTMDMLINEWGD
ncbi:hypothetical protein [Bosea sp. 2RAB26]|uniref:hypothetical protein n=1 Tax=Bosea sp. 2RAB26 TaxID=3237476 RepID=UPI003F8E4A7E